MSLIFLLVKLRVNVSVDRKTELNSRLIFGNADFPLNCCAYADKWQSLVNYQARPWHNCLLI